MTFSSCTLKNSKGVSAVLRGTQPVIFVVNLLSLPGGLCYLQYCQLLTITMFTVRQETKWILNSWLSVMISCL